MSKEIRHTGSFRADDDGRRYTIHMMTAFVTARDTGGTSTIPTVCQLVTEDGHHVNRNGKDEYEVAHNGVRLHSDDPIAP